MRTENRTVLIEISGEPFLSAEEELHEKFADYFERFTESPVEEHLVSVFELKTVLTPQDAFKQGYITKGQWILWVVENFYGQMTNGGIAQFLVNCEDLIVDVAIVLETLELTEFSGAYVELVQPLIVDLDKHRKSTEGFSVFRRVRAMFHDFEVIRQQVVKNTVGSKIDEQFCMKWDDERSELYWPPELWSQQLLARTMTYIEANPTEFQHFSN